MSIELADFTALLIVVIALGAIAVAAVATLATTFLVQNRRVRVARHEPIRAYYGHLILGH